jgi:hypothetical protein
MFLKYKIKSYQNILQIVFGGIDFLIKSIRKQSKKELYFQINQIKFCK